MSQPRGGVGDDRRSPIVELLRLRQDLTSALQREVVALKDHIPIPEMPVFTAGQIARFETKLSGVGSLECALEALPFGMGYSSDYTALLAKRLEETESLPVAQQFVFMFNCMAWISMKNRGTNGELVSLLGVLNQCCESFASASAEIFVELTKISIDSGVLDESDEVVRRVLRHLTLNETLPGSFSEMLMRVLDRLSRNGRRELIGDYIVVVAKLFAAESRLVQFEEMGHVITLLSSWFNDLDENAVLISAYASQHCSEGIIECQFVVLPTLVLAKFREMPAVLTLPTGNRAAVDDTSGKPGVPLESLIVSEYKMDDICDGRIAILAERLNVIISVASESVVRAFVVSLANLQSTLDTCAHAPDFLLMVSLLLSGLNKKTSIAPLLSLIFKSVLFDPEKTIFASEGITERLNAVRNWICDHIANVGAGMLYDAIHIVSNFPYIMAELVMRLSYKNGSDFFANEQFLSDLLSALNALRRYDTGPERGTAEKVGSVLFSTFFGIIGDAECALLCFTKEPLLGAILNILYHQSHFSFLVIGEIASCISKFQELPDEVISFLSMLVRRCTDQFDLEYFRNLGVAIMKGIIHILSHSPKLGPSLGCIFDDTLNFVRCNQRKACLEDVMTILTFMTQSDRTLKFSDGRFNTLLELRQAIEGDEPSEGFLLGCMNLMYASTHLSLDMMFLIEICDVIPFVLCAYVKSRRRVGLFDMFRDLCAFSPSNIMACHNGKLDFLLLEALRGGFELRKQRFEFDFTPDEREAVLKLVAVIANVRSSIEVDNAFLDLMMSTEDNLETAQRALCTLHELYADSDEMGCEIWSPEPIYTVNGISGTDLTKTFAFSCFVKIDMTSVSQSEVQFVFLRIDDNNSRLFEIVHHGESIVCRYSDDKVRTSAPLLEKLPSNEWTLLTTLVTIEDEGTYVSFRWGHSVSDEVRFRHMPFDTDVKVSLGMTNKSVIAQGSFSPVSIGKFALIVPSADYSELDALRVNGFSGIRTFDHVVFSWMSSNCRVSLHAQREDMSIVSLMSRHVRISDFVRLFSMYRCCDSVMSLELALFMLIQCTDFRDSCNSGKVFISLIEGDQSHFQVITELSGIQETFFKGYNCASSPLKFSMHLSEVSVIISHILHSRLSNLDSALFPAFLEMVSSTNDEELMLEILENAALNIWAWAANSASQCQKICRVLTNYLSQFTFPKENDLFTECLVQSHIFQNFSTKTWAGFHSIKMNLLKLLPLNEKALTCFIAVILSTESQEQLTDYLNLLLQSSVKVPTDLLIELTDLFAKCTPSQASQIMQIIMSSTSEEPTVRHLCFIQLGMKCGSYEMLELVENDTDILCIGALRKNLPIKLMDLTASLAQEMTRFWYIWPVFVAVYVDENMMNFVADRVMMLGAEQIPFYVTHILNLLEVIRATNVFGNVHKMAKLFICKVVDFLSGRSVDIAKASLRQVIFRLFVSLFYKVKLSPNSSAMKRALQDSPFASDEVPVDPRPKGGREFSYDNMKLVFGEYLNQMQFSFWRSRSRKLDGEVVARIVSLIEQALARSEDDKFLGLLQTYLTKSGSVHVTNEVFDFFSSSADSVQILTGQVKEVLKEIITQLNPTSQSEFDRHAVLTRYYNSERLRLKRIWQCTEDTDIVKNVLSSRCVKFPFSYGNVGHWIQDDSCTFEVAKDCRQTENVTLVYSTPCQMVNLQGRHNVTFTLLSNDEMRISQIGKPVMSVKFEFIHVILAVRPDYIEIYTGCCQSLLLYFSAGQASSVIGKLQQMHLKMVTDGATGIQQLMCIWADSLVSNFDLLLGLNFLRGRSFNDIYFYPMAPIVWDNRFLSRFHLIDNRKYITAVSRWIFSLNLLRSESLPMPSFNAEEELARAISDPGCVAPQAYFSFATLGEEHCKEIYSSRKAIDEIPDIGKKVEAWIETMFDVHLPAKTATPVHAEGTMSVTFRKKGMVTHAGFFDGCTNIFYAYFDDSTIAVYQLMSWIQPPVLLRNFENQVELNDSLEFCAPTNTLLIIDCHNSLAYRVGCRSQNEKIMMSLYVSLASPVGDSVVFVVDRHLIVCSHGSGFPLSRRTIIAEADEIVQLHTSAGFGCVVYVTERGVMQVVSIATSRVLGRHVFEDETVEKILVTSTWGFICVKTDKHLYTCSINGSVLAVMDFPAVIVHWITRSENNSVDYVILLNESNQLFRYEAFHMATMKRVGELTEAIIAMNFSRQSNAVLLITRDGRTIFHPCPD